MNNKELAELVVIRNHLAYLINSERGVIPSSQVRAVDAVKNKLDKIFVDAALKLELTVPAALKPELSVPGRGDEKPGIEVANGSVVFNPNKTSPEADKVSEPQLVDKPASKAPKASQKAQISEAEAAELKEIQEKVAKAKTEMKGAKKKGTAVKRFADLDEETEEDVPSDV